ncbi:hypothetical protein JVT61DRAFT_790 [Boletus reticuloceps]|uniref:Uncharacterized protein n=1 Tax=Boletus reticuloceps TaxID=495285 RepID=A0A8I3AH28_9AGAM|nr:hypothetical protein JVT61DRAFT_790 [Boletus reticuloceps]
MSSAEGAPKLQPVSIPDQPSLSPTPPPLPMFPNRLWAAFPFRVVPWEDSDTLHFHARLLRCFLLGLVNVQSELDPALISPGPERSRAWHMWTILGQRLADVGLGPDADLHAHEPLSHRVRAAILARCPPKRRYEAPTWLSFTMDTTADVPTDHTVHVAPPFVPHPIHDHDHDHNHNFTHGLHDKGMRSAVIVDIRPVGYARVLGRYDGGPGVIGCLLVGLLALAIVLSRFWSVAKVRSACRVSTATDASEWVFQSLSWDPFAICEAAQDLVLDTYEEVGYRTSMPGAWLHERPGQDAHDTFKKSVLTVIPWSHFYSCIQMGVRARAYFSGPTSSFGVLDHLDRGASDVIITGRDDHSPVSNGFDLDDGVLTPAVLNGTRQSGTTPDRDVAAIGRPGDGHSSVSNEFDLDAGVLTPAMLNGTEQAGSAPDHGPSEFGLSTRNLRGSAMPMDNRCLEPSAMCDVAVKEPDHPQMTALDVASEDQIGLAFTLVASTHVDRASHQKNASFDGDESASKDRSDGELFDIGTWCADDGNGEWRRQDGALSETECPLSLRRARSTGCLWRRRHVFDDDGDSDSTEQFNARLSNDRESREVPCRNGWPGESSWQREGREDETDNWRMRIPRVTQSPKEMSGARQCRIDNNSTKSCRYLSPPPNANDGAGSGDGPQGVYLVPQKRGGRWSPVSRVRRSDRPSGLGFFPLRKTPTLLTPKARRPVCLYIPDPPAVKSNEADAWWDRLTRGGACATGHTGGGVAEVCSRGAPDGPVSWRDRHEHDPASRRIMFGHRRTMTQG